MDEIRLECHCIVRSKKNHKKIIRNRRTGVLSITSNAKAKQNEEDMIWQFRSQIIGMDGFPLRESCEVMIAMIEPDLRRRDLDNQATSILDALVGAGVILDDGVKHVSRLGIELAGTDQKDPRAIVNIKKLGGKK